MRVARGSAVAAVLLLATSAAASVDGDGPSPAADAAPEVNWATLAYTEPAPTYRLRLALEELFGVSAAFVGYLVDTPPEALPGFDPPYRPWAKLTFQPGTWTFDADDFGTNMAGHVAAGTTYYLIARGNRVSIPEAFAWTFGASLLWEVVEFREPVSINDMIMTSAGGLALGEAFQQLSAWFDRGGSDPASQALAFLFNPAKKIHDWIDRAVPDRDPRARGWHAFSLEGSVGFVWQTAPGATYLVAGIRGESRLFRAPGYGEPGRGTFTWGDGNASRISLGASFAGSTVLDFLFDTETALVGLYHREIGGAPDAREGWDLFLAGTAGYEYGVHRWDLSTGQPDNIALVRLPGVGLQARWFSSGWTLSAGLDLALTFGGVQPFAFQQPPFFLPDGTALPGVLLANGYYFAVGFRGTPSLEARWRDLSLGASFQSDLFWSVSQPDAVTQPGAMLQLTDQRLLASAWLRCRFPEVGLEAGLAGRLGWRSGTAGAIEASARETSVLGNLAVVF